MAKGASILDASGCHSVSDIPLEAVERTTYCAAPGPEALQRSTGSPVSKLRPAEPDWPVGGRAHSFRACAARRRVNGPSPAG